MEFSRHVSRMLHEEHMAALSLLERLESMVQGTVPSEPPDLADGPVIRLFGDLKAAIEGEISNHFEFEESELFPCLAKAGDGDLGELLSEEHKVILPLGRRLAELAGTARAGDMTVENWQEFRRSGAEFIERLRSHIDKEELALIPAAEAAINDDDDMRLAGQYAYSR